MSSEENNRVFKQLNDDLMPKERDDSKSEFTSFVAVSIHMNCIGLTKGILDGN